MASLTNLPDELIIMIAEACDVPDKARLARSNRRLNGPVNRVLLQYSVREEGNSATYWAAEHGHVDTLERMRSCGAEVNDNSGSRLSIVVRRLHAYPQKRLHTSVGFFPLHIAAKFGQESVVKWFLNNGARTESLAQHVCQCQPSSEYVGRDGDFDEFDDYDEFDDFEFHRRERPHAWSALHIAICSGHTTTARLLISRGALIRSPGSGRFLGTNVFHTAARCNNTTAIEFLVGSGLVDVDEPDSMGYTALHHACSSPDNLPAIKTLVHLGASLDILSESCRRTALRVACMMGFFEGAMVLLREGAVHDISSRDMAASLWRVATRRRTSFPQRHKSPDPAIWETNREEFLRRLVALGTNIDERLSGSSLRYYTPLAGAAADPRSLLRTLQVLLELGADVNATDDDGKNIIYLLLENSRTDFYGTTANKVDFLLRHGARPDMRAKYRRCAFDMALRLAAAQGDASIMGFILQHPFVANYGHIYVHDQIRSSYDSRSWDECRILARNGGTLEVSDKELDEGVRYGVNARDLKHIDGLLDLFADRVDPFDFLEIVIESYQTPGVGEISIIKSLLARPRSKSPGSIGTSWLLQVACRYHSSVVIAQLLLENGVVVNTFDTWWETPLSCAVARGCRATVRLLLLHGADPHKAPSNQKWSAYVRYVHEATHRSDRPGTDLLDTGYPTSFTRAIMEFHNHRRGHGWCHLNSDNTLPTPLELILEHLPLPALPQDPRALSYIHLALEFPEALRVLLAKGADPNSGDHCVRPPLLYFLDMADVWRPAKPDTLAILLEFGADIHRTDERGRSFLTMMRLATLPMANGVIDNAGSKSEGLRPTAGLLLRNFFTASPWMRSSARTA